MRCRRVIGRPRPSWRACGRASQGQRLRAGVAHGHWKTTTFVAGLRASGMVAPFVLDGPINRDAFEVYVEQVLVPELYGPSIWWSGLSVNRWGSIAQVLQMNSYGVRPRKVLRRRAKL